MSTAGKRKSKATQAQPSAPADIRMARTLAQVRQKSSRRWILCPWLGRFSVRNGLWLSVLASHDANGALLEALPPSGEYRPDVYAAVFAVDVLRSSAQLMRCIQNAGIGGVINFPSVSFIDGEAGATLENLSLGVSRELEFLEACVAAGLRIAGVVGSLESAQRLLAAGADFLIVHGGAPRKSGSDADTELMTDLRALDRRKGVPVLSLSELNAGRNEK